MTQIDVMCFGKFKALTNYSKVGTHAHMKHLFVGAWNLSGGLSCLETSISTMLQSSPPLCFNALSGGSPKVLPPCLPPYLSNVLSNTNKQCSSVLQGSLLLSLVTKYLGKGLTWLGTCTVQSLSYSTLLLRSCCFFFLSLQVEETSCEECCS